MFFYFAKRRNQELSATLHIHQKQHTISYNMKGLSESEEEISVDEIINHVTWMQSEWGKDLICLSTKREGSGATQMETSQSEITIL